MVDTQALYRQKVRAWTLYDWANSAFATTIVAAVLPVYYSTVAGAALPSETIATAYWSLGLSLSLLVVALLSPILGTISDVMRGKKRFLSAFAGLGIVSTALLALAGTGDLALASALAVLGRIGFNGSLTFYDALLPHVAREDDRDRVSALGFAMGYLGGGLLLAINIAMIQVWGFERGARISFVSVAVWWLIFSLPLLFQVPEPPAAQAALGPGETVVGVSFRRLGETFHDLRRYRELFKFLIAFLIYNDGIGTIIGVAAIYATELGFGALETILVLLLVQFTGIPFSLIFGRITDPSARRRPAFLAFIVFNLVALPAIGVAGRRLLPVEVSGAAPAPFTTVGGFYGEGSYPAAGDGWVLAGESWQRVTIPGELLRPAGLLGFLNDPFGGMPADETYLISGGSGAVASFPFYGERVRLTYATGPDYGVWEITLDGRPLTDEAGSVLTLDARSTAARYGVAFTITAPEPGRHTLTLTGTEGGIGLAAIEVLPPTRAGGFALIGQIVGLLLVVNIVSLGLAFWLGPPLFGGLAAAIDTRRGIMLALVVYATIAVWGYFIDSTIEFWFLAWMVAMAQGGSQALSRSLYAAMSPATKSGEFFGLFSVMEKFASLIGPLLFAAAGFWLGSSRWGVLSLIVFFVVGLGLLSLVDVEEGRRVAEAEDRASELATLPE